MEHQLHGADFNRLLLPAEDALLPAGRLDVDDNDAALAGNDRPRHFIDVELSHFPLKIDFGILTCTP